MTRHKHLSYGLLASASLFGLLMLIYIPGLPGGFVFDDFPNLVENEQVRIQSLGILDLWQAAWSGISGALGRHVSMLSFGIGHAIHGMDPLAFKITNILIHAFNGLLVYWLSVRLLSHVGYSAKRKLHLSAYALTAIWLLHPIQLTSILFTTQRMTELSALFVLLGMLSYAKGRERMLANQGGYALILAALFLAWPLATFSKENGALLPGFFLLLEFFVYRFKGPEQRISVFVPTLLLTVLFAALVAGLSFVDLSLTRLEEDNLLRGMTTYERLLTESRVLWFYLQLLLVPDISSMSLFHDNIVISHGFWSPTQTGIAVLGLFALCVLAIALRSKVPLIGLGIMLFLTGHSLESGPIPLDLAYEHRNYLPSFGIWLAIVPVLLDQTLQSRTIRLRYLFVLLFTLILATNTALRANHWGQPVAFALHISAANPNSARAQYTAARLIMNLYMLAPNRPEPWAQLADQLLQRSIKADPDNPLPLAGRIKVLHLSSQSIPDDLYPELQKRLLLPGHQPQAPATFRTLMHCDKELDCALSQSKMLSLFQTTIEKAKINPMLRAHIIDLYGTYLWQHLDQKELAIEQLKKASLMNQYEPQHQLNLIHMLIASNQLERALEELQILKTRDKWHAHSVEIEQLQKTIKSRTKKK